MASDGNSVGAAANSTTEKLFNVRNVTSNKEFASKSGPVGQSSQPNKSAAIITGTPRGVLQQMNVGDVCSAVDQLSKLIANTVIKGKGINVDSNG